MCGRFTLRTPLSKVVEQFELPGLDGLTPRYNIAPSQAVAVVRQTARLEEVELRQTAAAGPRELALLKWGLVPSWADEAAIGNRLINARGETAAEKPAFRTALRQRRCLIPADGFFEWRTAGKTRQPYYITLHDEGLFAIAGLYEHWHRGEQVIDSCTILTTAANNLLQSLHDRMPVILAPADYRRWLDPSVTQPADIADLLVPFDAAQMQFRPVNPVVNGTAHDSPRCIQSAPGLLF